ncbi:unnamed protein product [Allacma fusca]|uniref:Uncharacterized protein n=1 Tax=Allacma fusca TaxID=39272 RepID=A0A8J2JQR6_9HEXA|nr:unnamed protein product [Allacma fusca]
MNSGFRQIGFVACTVTNPVWFVKTRLQLDQQHRLSTRETIRRIYARSGLLGFYKGITASYMGISETVIHFVIYEAVKKRLQDWSMSHRTLVDEDYDCDSKTFSDFVQFMAAGAISKTTASCIAYPHEVARTRLREEGSKYRSFWQTLALVCKEEGYRGMYRGLVTQLIRQIPNTAIMMSTYEASVYLLNKYIPDKASAGSGNELTGADALNRLPGEDYDDNFSYEVPSAHPDESNSQNLT